MTSGRSAARGEADGRGAPSCGAEGPGGRGHRPLGSRSTAAHVDHVLAALHGPPRGRTGRAAAPGPAVVRHRAARGVRLHRRRTPGTVRRARRGRVAHRPARPRPRPARRRRVEHVLAGFADLAVHPDVPAGLRALRGASLRLVTLGNGAAAVAERLMDRAGLRAEFERRGPRRHAHRVARPRRRALPRPLPGRRPHDHGVAAAGRRARAGRFRGSGPRSRLTVRARRLVVHLEDGVAVGDGPELLVGGLGVDAEVVPGLGGPSPGAS